MKWYARGMASRSTPITIPPNVTDPATFGLFRQRAKASTSPSSSAEYMGSWARYCISRLTKMVSSRGVIGGSSTSDRLRRRLGGERPVGRLVLDLQVRRLDAPAALRLADHHRVEDAGRQERPLDRVRRVAGANQ